MNTELAPLGGDNETSSVKSFESSERPESRRESLYYLAEDIAEDLGHPTTRKGWMNYWGDRLADELREQKVVGSKQRHKYLQARASEEIFDAQMEERRTQVMRRLARRLADIDARVDYSLEEQSGRQNIFFDREKQELFVEAEGKRYPTSLDDAFLDLDWGVQYRPDTDVPAHLWRQIRKRSDIAEARSQLEMLFNEELAKREQVSMPTTAIGGEWIEKEFQNSPKGLARAALVGAISERMAKNMLNRAGRKDRTLNMRVENSNALEDTELKYDFKVFTDARSLGVATAPEGMEREEYTAHKRSLGIQFTTSARPDLIEKKVVQLAEARKHLDDLRTQKYIKHPVTEIILIQTNLGAMKRYEQWLQLGKPPGGPEQFISKEEQQSILSKISAALTPSNEVREKTAA